MEQPSLSGPGRRNTDFWAIASGVRFAGVRATFPSPNQWSLSSNKYFFGVNGVEVFANGTDFTTAHLNHKVVLIVIDFAID